MTSITASPSLSTPYPRLVADVGGTNARFGWISAPAQPISHVRALPTAEHATLVDAARAYLSIEALPAPAAMAMGIANPVNGDEVRMTNHHWAFSISAMQAELGLQRLQVLNDFTALALSLPSLQPAQLRQIGGGAAQPNRPMALLGPGTGLGVSGLLPAGEQWIPLAGEGGHVTLAAADEREAAVLTALRERFGHVSAERAVSGSGLVNLLEAVTSLRRLRTDVSKMTPANLTACALGASEARQRGMDVHGLDAACLEALQHFCAFLGNVAGNLALTLGAFGGVYIGGGIVPRLGDFFERSRFRDRFEAKGRFNGYLSTIPVYVINANVSPALEGAARSLDQA
ncbi:MAG: glucokinase [Leptothrix sp. (in: b-proteobacteria)]